MASTFARTLLLAGITLGLMLSCEEAAVVPQTTATYVGRSGCAACHAQEHTAHHGSHHDLAMQPATAETVLGDFTDTSFVRYGVTTDVHAQG